MTFWIWLDRLCCGWKGHDAFTKFERDRISLKCVACGWESSGW